MTLRSRYRDIPETVQDLELAGEARYFAGLCLLVEGEYHGGVYLLGYTVEMLLKFACYRVSEAHLSDAVSGATYRRWARALPMNVAAEGFHGLQFWATLLKEKRKYLGRALERSVEQPLVQRVRRIQQSRFVEMRYRTNLVTRAQADQVYNDVSWIRTHRVALWR